MLGSRPEYNYGFEDDSNSDLYKETHCFPHELFEQWGRISVETKRDAGERMKVCAFWHPILLQPEPSCIVALAAKIGLISEEGKDLSLEHLCKIEFLETVLAAMEKGSLKIEPTRQIFLLSNLLTSDPDQYRALHKAIAWLEKTAGPGISERMGTFGDSLNCIDILRFVFTEFARYIEEMANDTERTMKALMARPQEFHAKKCEEMKKRGNENYEKQQYEDAVKCYSKAIIYYPDNHMIYGNRALCYIKCKNYLKAAVDGKRATLIKPHWAKGHYRYCDALFLLGEVQMAMKANRKAQKLCKADLDGLKDLEQQRQKFVNDTADPKAGHPRSKSKRSDSANRPGAVESQQQSAKANSKVGVTSKAPQTKVSAVKLAKQQVKNERPTQADSNTKDSKPLKSDPSQNGKEESSTAVKKKKNPCLQPEEEKVNNRKVAVCKELRSTVQDAHTALTDLRSRNAEQAFSQALAIVDSQTPKDLGLSTVDVLLLLYGRASALTEIGQPEELAEAHKLLEKIKSYEQRTFQCLVYYAIGKVYLKENRFAVALEPFSDSLQMVKNQITPGKLTWPLTKEIVKETLLDYLKVNLENAIELCKFPPIPDAICRLENCLAPLKAEIYFTDPDFKGFIRIGCSHNCIVEYHIACWKVFKTTSFSEKNDKDFLQEMCLTPDCVGKICYIQIYGPTGLLKCKFEAAIVRPQTQKNPKVNQKCTSLKKLKSKEERRLKRKQHKLSFQHETIITHDVVLPKKEDTESQIQQKAWLLYRDRVLLQISQNMHLLREENDLQVSALTTCLKPWLELDSSRGNRLAQKLLNWQQEAIQTVGQVVELLLERKNRVWARVFIQVLSSCQHVNPKLNTWACKLNDAGLTAAKSFIERHAEHLEQLDLNLLLNFGPVEELIMENLGTRPELLSSIGLTVAEYLKQAPSHDTRLFIWALEEHRQEYVSCHTILDEYFDMMDGHCSVLKKSDESENNSLMKTKNRGRKKKQKEPKGVIILSGMRSLTQRDEWDQDLFEDDSLSFLHPADPAFSVPYHLREQVADFEEQYNSTRNGSQYKNILDNNPDPTKETLYDYFAQILEEHGPLVAEDPLLVGELENFPSMAQLNIQEAGGFESFLLNSLRFIKMGRCIGLAKHAVSLQQAGHGSCLDELDDIVDPDTNSEFPEANYTNYVGSYLSTEAEVFLPNPYVYPYESGTNHYSHWSNGDEQQQVLHFLTNDYENMDLYTSEDGFWPVESQTTEDLVKHASVQTCQDTMRSVTVNTEPFEPFETCPGDLNKKAKINQELEQHMENMANGCDKVDLKQKEELASLEEEIQKINVNIQVTNTELMLFQQKLEEEVKKDQKEKKANQEALKSLKVEIEKLVEEQRSLAKSIREKKAQYDAKLTDFLDLGNQSAAEKMSLEDEIKHCKALLASATRRSHKAQLSLVESRRDQGLYSLYTELADAKALLGKLEDVSHRFTNQDLERTKSTCRATVLELEKNISTAQTQYQQQIDQVKNGRRVNELIPVKVNSQPKPAPLPAAAKEVASQALAQMSHKAPSPVHLPGAEALVTSAQPQHKPNRTVASARATVFEKAMERLAVIFPDYTRSDLMRFLQELRLSSEGSLGSMTLEGVVDGVTQLILDHQDNINSGSSNTVGRREPAHSATPPLVTPAPVWQSVGHQRTTHSSALNMEDPCIICHEDMSSEDLCVLECRHSFHKECIRSWLKEQSTCPTCRDHALLPEDFPVLTARRRQVP